MPSGSSTISEPELGVWLLAIPTASDQADLAREFIEYATDLVSGGQLNEQSMVAAHRDTPPPRISVLASLESEPRYKYEHPSLIPHIRLSLENARPRPRTPCWKKIESVLGVYLQKVIDQPTGSKDLALEANRDLESLFDEQGCRLYLRSTDQK